MKATTKDGVSEYVFDGMISKDNRVVVGCFTSQQHVSVSQVWICSDKCMCCHTEIEVADYPVTVCLHWVN